MPKLTSAQLRSVWAFVISILAPGTGRLIVATAVGKQVYDISHRAIDLGWLGLIEFAPSFLLVLVSGSIADRFDRRRIAAYAITLDAIGACLLTWNAAADSKSIAIPFLVVGLMGVGRAFYGPSQRAMPVDVVPIERVPWMVARYSISTQTAMILGPVLGGFLYAATPAAPYAAAAIAYGIGAVAVMLVTYAHAGAEVKVVKEKATLHEALEGVRVLKTERVLLGAISLDLFAVLFGGAVALLPAIAEDRLHVGAVGLGWLRASVGIGASLMTLGLFLRPIRRHVGHVLLGVVAVFGVFTIVLGITTNFALAMFAVLILSAADSISVFIRSTLVPLVTPASKRGRVLALESVFIGASNELGAFESGLAAQLLTTATAVVFGGAMTLGVAVLWIFLFPKLWNQDEFPVPRDD